MIEVNKEGVRNNTQVFDDHTKFNVIGKAWSDG